jgi:hypothetical protein
MNLTSMGNGIGGFMSGFNEQQKTAAALEMLQSTLKDAQLGRTARGIITSVAGLGTPAAGLSGGLPGSPTAPPPPGQASVPAAPQPDPAQQAYAPALTPPQAAQPQAGPDPSDGASIRDPLPLNSQQEVAIPGAEPEVSGQGAPAPQPGGAPPPTPAPGAPSQPAQGGAAAAPQMNVGQQMDAGQQPQQGNYLEMAQNMLRHESFESVVQRIRKARPDADPVAVEMAAETMFKMANTGDKMQAAGLAATLKYLGVKEQIGSREKIAGEQIKSRERNVDVQQAGATGRTELQQAGAGARNQNTVAGAGERGAAHDAATDARAAAGRQAAAERNRANIEAKSKIVEQQIASKVWTQQQKAQALRVNTSYKNITTQLAALRGQVDPKTGFASKAAQDQMKALQDQAVKLYAELKSQGLTVETPNALTATGDQTGQEVPIK